MLGIVALVLQLSTPTAPPQVHGTVVSQDELPVEEALVQLACDREVARTVTNATGRFSVTRPAGAAHCTLLVSRAGFVDTVHAVAPDGDGPVLVQLAIMVVEQHVTVRGTLEPSFVQPIGSVVLSQDEILRLADGGEDVIGHAARLNSVGAFDTAVYVDGLPAAVLPPPDMIRQVTVTSGPFSAEHGDGDTTTVLVATRGLVRRFRVSPSGSVLAFGGDGLRPGLQSESAGGSLSASGPIPLMPITWSGTISRGRYANQVALAASIPEVPGLEPFTASSPDMAVTSSGRTSSLTMHASYEALAGTRVHGAYSATRSTGSNAGVGGIVLPSAGFATRSIGRGMHVSASVPGRRLLFEGGLVTRLSSSTLRANSAVPGLAVTGEFVAGGAMLSLDDSRRLTSTARFVVRNASRHAWSAGVFGSHVSVSDQQVPNPHGVLQFASEEALAEALAGAPTATWSGIRGDGRVLYRGIGFAPFFQRVVVSSHRMHIETGMRADYRSGTGWRLSPRIWSAVEWNGLVVQAGSGVFARHVGDAVFVKALWNDGAHLQEYVASAVGFANGPDLVEQRRMIRTTLAPGLTSARQLMHRVAIERRIAGVTPSLEYTWTSDAHRLGAERTAADGEWLDVIASNRSAVRHRLRGRIAYEWRRQSLTGIYEWLHAVDNGDGPFAYAERSSDLRAEWARTAGLPPHAIGIVAGLRLPLGIHTTVSDRWQSGVPYNVTSRSDLDGDGLFADRDGRQRNSGRSPFQHVVSLQLSVRVQLPPTLRRLNAPEGATWGMQIENLLNSRNYTALGSVLGSSLFGRPISATTSRSVRFSLTIN